MDDEAEEEEEDGAVRGLGDYGFTSMCPASTRKKVEGEDERVYKRKGDFENIVDDLSADEGDDQAGDAYRREEDKKRDLELEEKVRKPPY